MFVLSLCFFVVSLSCFRVLVFCFSRCGGFFVAFPGLDKSDMPASQVRSAAVTDVDRLGMYVVVTLPNGKPEKLRLPFPRPATERKDIRTLVVGMTQAATGAATAGQAGTGLM